MEIGDRIKELRKQADMTQDELADKLGMKKAAISKIETGRVTNIKRSTIAMLANIFDVDGSYIIGIQEIKKRPRNDIKSLFDRLDSSDKEHIMKEIIFMLSQDKYKTGDENEETL